MKTKEFVNELEEFKEEIDNKDYIIKNDLLRLLNYYIKLSALDYMYLDECYKLKPFSNFKNKTHSNTLLDEMYNKYPTIGNNLTKSQEILRDIKNKANIREQELFKKGKLDYLFQYLDMVSYSGTIIVGNLFIDYMNKNISTYYDKIKKHKVSKKNIEVLEELHKDLLYFNDLNKFKEESELFFIPLNNKEIKFKLGNMIYKYNGINEGDGVINILNRIYNKNTRKRKTDKDSIKSR